MGGHGERPIEVANVILQSRTPGGLGKNCYSCGMSISAAMLAAGSGWCVQDVRCTYGPRDRPFEEQHSGVSIAVVTSGTFTYRTAQGSAVLAPGAVLLGNAGQCFECGHEHSVGDRCLAFHLSPELVESVVAQLPGMRHLKFAVPSLPPVAELIPVVADADAAWRGSADVSFEELALDVVAKVGTVLAVLDSAARPTRRLRSPSRRDQQRVTEALRRIEAESDRALSLQDLAGDAAMSPYHFLRVFRAVAGTTPHQFLLHTRLQRAAARLRGSQDTIASIAADAGFTDLSTFNRRFRRLIGANPSAYRSGRGRSARGR
jgi:AraC family transcriptional regulator